MAQNEIRGKSFMNLKFDVKFEIHELNCVTTLCSG